MYGQRAGLHVRSLLPRKGRSPQIATTRYISLSDACATSQPSAMAGEAARGPHTAHSSGIPSRGAGPQEPNVRISQAMGYCCCGPVSLGIFPHHFTGCSGNLGKSQSAESGAIQCSWLQISFVLVSVQAKTINFFSTALVFNGKPK